MKIELAEYLYKRILPYFPHQGIVVNSVSEEEGRVFLEVEELTNSQIEFVRDFIAHHSAPRPKKKGSKTH